MLRAVNIKYPNSPESIKYAVLTVHVIPVADTVIDF